MGVCTVFILHSAYGIVHSPGWAEWLVQVGQQSRATECGGGRESNADADGHSSLKSKVSAAVLRFYFSIICSYHTNTYT